MQNLRRKKYFLWWWHETAYCSHIWSGKMLGEKDELSHTWSTLMFWQMIPQDIFACYYRWTKWWSLRLQVFCWKTTPFNPNVTPSSDQIGEGPVLSIRFSLDLKLLAVQRSHHEVQIQNRESGDTFSFKCRSESERILGFFWTDSPTCDIVFVKTRYIAQIVLS